MVYFSIGTIANIIIAAVGISVVVAVVGMVIWYIRIKPDMENVKKELGSKAASSELIRMNEDLARKKDDSERQKDDSERLVKTLAGKQSITECELQRHACQPLLLEQLKGLSFKIDDLRETQKVFSGKLDRLMMKNGITV